MLKRLLDIAITASALLLASPFLAVICALVWLQDYKSPFYVATRVGRGGKDFRMVKLRSMVVNADKTGVNSTSANDMRITPIGHFIRRYKLDELTQMWNVLIGDMSLIGPRPNTRAWGTDLYTAEERRLLSVRPGISDFSSIVFSDEGEILKDKPHADLVYNQLIRPWKSRLGLLYIDHSSVKLDLRLVWLTGLAIISKRRAIDGVVALIQEIGAPAELVEVAKRESKLVAAPPPGADEVFGLEHSSASSGS